MSKISMIEIVGSLEVCGIYNYNRVVKFEGNENHKAAKQNNKKIDFTSSRCLRHEMFKDIQPKQPSSEESKKAFIKIAASEVGLLRGVMDADRQLKRSSPLSILDAYTDTEETVLFIDQGSSSKPKEKKEEKSDTSMFSQDGAPKRNQNFNGIINIQQLQFIEQGKAGQGNIVPKDDQEDYIKELKNTMAKLGVVSDLKIKEYKLINAITPIDFSGILFNKNEINTLVKNATLRMVNISGYKAGSSIRSLKNTFKVRLYLHNSLNPTEINLDTFMNDLDDNKYEYTLFYEAKE